MEKIINSVGWNFDNSYARLPGVFFTAQQPEPAPSPVLVCCNEALAADLGLSGENLKSEAGVTVLAGNRLPDGAAPLAQAYAGHQFGHFTMLGDGRAILLGEQLTPLGERYDLQLKGAGRTPYSRRGDGRAALGPMLREYIISEAMHGLGIATTRSLAVVTTGQAIRRETELPGAVLTRVAASHLRVGTFEYAARWGSAEELRLLTDYAINRHFPELTGADGRYLLLLRGVIGRQAGLIAAWQLVGFIHGVMNTDNMTISGETIDYGPCAFMDNYDSATVFSSIDHYGRYAYGNQPQIAAWNLARFAETLLPLLDAEENTAIELAQAAIAEFPELYHRHWLAGMRAKLGLYNEEAQDETLVESLLALLHKQQADYTNTFLDLTFDTRQDAKLWADPEFTRWHEAWRARLARQQETPEAVRQQMKCHNPALIPRNHQVEAALDSAVRLGDYQVMERLLRALARPYEHRPEQACYAELPQPSAQPYRTFCGT
ncbi:protein adenylyltransferase SelO [Propionispora vibrioides]|uniref:Protein nucleotidyltransferase YdiU n=1 Tax=Propionispora vibrioides TaxID=112903 RepID=A0A1H8TFH5_9FIRM|nr:YdiU family protein [Propionispora vibrioides]SEO89662.1 Uncharacterized conserved protein YdiU, UPF0061 family [Propionispora vibrioides]